MGEQSDPKERGAYLGRALGAVSAFSGAVYLVLGGQSRGIYLDDIFGALFIVATTLGGSAIGMYVGDKIGKYIQKRHERHA